MKMNATEGYKERKKECLERCHPDLVAPDRWPVRHEQLTCMTASETRGLVNSCRFPLSLLLLLLSSLLTLYFGLQLLQLIQYRASARAKERVWGKFQKKGQGENNPQIIISIINNNLQQLNTLPLSSKSSSALYLCVSDEYSSGALIYS